MGTGYTRNDTSNNIADGNIINAADLDGEFDAIESAFGTSGHTHDGTSAEGGPITVLGPVQDFVASATEIKPKTTNTLDIGTSSLLFKDMYLDGVATLGSIKIDNAGTIGSASDSDAIAISSGGVVTFSQAPLVDVTNATTNAVTDVLGIQVQSSGTPAVGIGSGLTLGVETAAGNVETGGAIRIVSTGLTPTDEEIDLVFYSMRNGSLTEAFRFDSSADSLSLNDSVDLSLGSDDDLTLVHSGTHGTVTNSTGNLTFDVAGDIILDADDGDIQFKNGGTLFGSINSDASSPQAMRIQSHVSDGDIIFKGNDGGSTITALQLDMSDAGTAIFNHDITLPDNGKAIFGAGSDLQIYHDGASYITENGQGSLFIEGTNLFLRDSDGNNYIGMDDLGTGGQVKLYHNAQEKLATLSTGIDVTGTVTADGLTVDGVIEVNTARPQIFLYENDRTGNNTRLESSFDNFNIAQVDDTNSNPTNRMQVEMDTGDISFYEDTGTTAKFFWDASAESLVIGASSTATVFEATGSKNDQWAGKFTNTNSGGFGVLAITAGSTANEKAFEVRKNTSDTAMLIDGLGNVGIDFTPKTMNANVTSSLNVGSGTVFQRTKDTYLGSNMYYDASDIGKSISTGYGLAYYQDVTNGAHKWFTSAASAGSADATHSFSIPMVIDSSGRVGIGTTSPSSQDTSGNNFVIHDTAGNGGLTIVTPTNAIGGIHFSDGTSGADRYRGIISYSHSENSLRFHTDTARAMTIDSNGFVGVGTSSPLSGLHISDGTNAGSPQNASRSATLMIDAGATASADLQFMVRNGYNSHIFFGDAADPNVGIILYDHSANAMVFNTNAGERMRIDSSGNLLVGTTSSSNIAGGTSGSGMMITPNHGEFKRSDGAPLFLNRTTSDGTIAQFRRDGTSVGSIGYTSAGVGYFAGSSTGVGFGSATVYPTDGSGNLNSGTGVKNLGSQTYPWLDLYLSGGIQFDSRSNKLDDYEEGTWSPEIQYQNSTDNGNTTESTQTGNYTKIGRLVFVEFRVIWSLTGSPATDNILLDNLPFVHSNTAANTFSMNGIARAVNTSNDTLYYLNRNAANTDSVIITNSDGNGNMGATIGANSTNELRGSYLYYTT